MLQMSIYKIGQWNKMCLPNKCKLSNKTHYGDDKGLKNKIQW